MFKRLSLMFLVLVAGLTLVACETEEPLSDGEVIRAIRDTILFDTTNLTDNITIPVIEEDGVIVEWVSSNPAYLDIDGTITRPPYYFNDQRVSLTVSLQLNDAVVTKVFEFIVMAEDRPEVIELNTDETDNLALDFDFENTDFIADGVGEVDLVRCVDGDTAFFTEGGSSFSVRFLGINTPESTAKFEPWGKAASDFTCDKLTNASQIVLQADPAAGRLDSYGERWLAWVWYDGRLLNLELVEQAYSKASGATDTLYGGLIFQTNLLVQFTERRVWGETDPNYDYSLEGIQLTIEELVTNQEDYVGLKVAIKGIVTRQVGAAVFIQQDDFGIYLYNRSWAPDLSVGNEVQLSGLTVTYYPDEQSGALQVSDYKFYSPYSTVLSNNNEVTPNTISIPDITADHIGSLLRVESLTVVSVYQNEDSFTLTVEDADGNTITVRKDASVTADITADMFPVGTTFTIVAPLSRYSSNYQLMLTSLNDVTME